MIFLHGVRNNRTVGCLACVLYCVLLFVVLMNSLLYYGWTNWVGEPVYWLSENGIACLMMILTWLLVLLEFPFSWRRSLLALVLLLIRQFFPVVGGSNFRILEMLILAILSNLSVRKATSWTWLSVHLVYVLLLVYFNSRALTADFLKPEAWLSRFGGEFGHSLGMAHSNSLGVFTLSVALMIRYLLPGRKPWLSLLLFAAAAFFCLWFAKSKTCVVLLLLSPVIIWLFGRLKLQGRRAQLLFALLPALACAVTFGLAWYYLLHQSQIRYSTFWMRFEELKYIIEYFHLPFGAPSFSGYDVHFDNFFVFLFTCCGYVPFLPLLFSFCLMNWRLAGDRQRLLLAVSVIFLLFSMMENCIFYPVHFFVPLLAFSKDSLSCPLPSGASPA